MKVVSVNSESGFYGPLQKLANRQNALFNTTAWTKNYPPENLVQCAILNNNNEVIGGFIYYRFKKSLFNFIIWPPYTPNIDLFFQNPSESVVGIHTFNKEVSEAVAAYFDSEKAGYIELSLPESIVDTQPFIWRNYTSKNRYSYLIDLTKSSEELWNNLSSEKRKSLNKAAKDNLEIRETTDYDTVYKLVIKSLTRSQISKNTQVIRNILFSFANAQNSISFTAYNNGVAIGASFCVIYQSTAIYLFGGFDAQNKHHGAGVSCMWRSILKAKELGLQKFDFEGSMNENIERYYREFGGELIKFACVEKVNPLLNSVLRIKGRRRL